MNRAAAYRGQPLVMLLFLLGAWVIARMLLWQTPFIDAPFAHPFEAVAAVVQETAPVKVETARPIQPQLAPTVILDAFVSSPRSVWASQPDSVFEPAIAAPYSMPLASQRPVTAGLITPQPKRDPAPAPAPFSPLLATTGQSATDRWSADAWLLLREDTTTPVTSGRGSYGQSQAGMVIRYRIAPSSAFRPTAYYRVSRALAGAQETEAALGLAARPIPGVPVIAAAEMRLTNVEDKSSFRPAAFAVTELPSFKLAAGFTGEAYVQAGYVGGDFETGFVDGQARAERRLVRLGKAELHAGGGVWAGRRKAHRGSISGPAQPCGWTWPAHRRASRWTGVSALPGTRSRKAGRRSRFPPDSRRFRLQSAATRV